MIYKAKLFVNNSQQNMIYAVNLYPMFYLWGSLPPEVYVSWFKMQGALEIGDFPRLTHLPRPPWTKCAPFHRRYFQMHFCECKVLYFD